MEYVIKEIVIKGKKQAIKEVDKNIFSIEKSIKAFQKLLEDKQAERNILIKELTNYEK